MTPPYCYHFWHRWAQAREDALYRRLRKVRRPSMVAFAVMAAHR